jgi:hypothetical protein
MKHVAKTVAFTLSAAALVAITGCTNIREYSVSSYQGVLPVNDFRPTSVTAARVEPEMPKSSVPATPPTAAPAAPQAPAAEPAKPAETTNAAPEPKKE